MLTAVPPLAAGWLITFTCGHVHHWHCPPAEGTGMWISCYGHGDGPSCQTPRQVESVKACPGCPRCWTQPVLITLEAA